MMGWRVMDNPVENATTAAHWRPHCAYDGGLAKLRWRGAAASGAGERFRNRHWRTGQKPARTKHVPIPFKNDPGYETGSPVTGNVGVVVLQAVNRSETY